MTKMKYTLGTAVLAAALLGMPAAHAEEVNEEAAYEEEAEAPAAAVTTTSTAAETSAAFSFPADLNRVSFEQLCSVSGINRPVAESIIEYREKHGVIRNYDELLDIYGPFDTINIEVFNDLQHTISGWPGGKPNADDSTRPVKSEPFPKKVLIFNEQADPGIEVGRAVVAMCHRNRRAVWSSDYVDYVMGTFQVLFQNYH